ncbi:substrate-binding domain-containing protein [Myxococcaceae bacterium GXIMD 01537]
MSTPTANRVRERRDASGLSQLALAEAANLTRQSIGAIEAGRATPGVDVALRLARALGCSVEDLFAEEAAEAPLSTESVLPEAQGRVALAAIGGRWVSYPLSASGMRTCADGIATRATRGRTEVEPVTPLAEARENLVVMGCAAALGILADRLNSRPGPGRFLWWQGSSTRALEALGKEQTHLAGVHLVDTRTQEANVADVRRHAGRVSVALITLGRWEAGLVTAPGNPKQIRRASDLARRGLRLVTREEGSGARRLLDQQLRAEGLSPSAALQASGHLEVAHAVALGAGDVGIATRDAAIAFGLGFVPLADERYDLVIPLAALQDPRVVRLLEVMTSGPVRRELSSLGYDVRSCGDRVAEVHAA